MTSRTRQTLGRLLIGILFSIAFAYIESAVVVYLREIFHPEGFTFPMQVFDLTAAGKRVLLTEVGREAATLVLLLTAAWLFGNTRQERAAWFLALFPVWDVFYYVWLKVLIDWPTAIMDWDILFLIPVIWAAPVLAPVLASAVMFAFAVAILHRSAHGRPLAVTYGDWLGWLGSAAIIIVSFCLGGTHIGEENYMEYFHWPLFAVGLGVGTAACATCLRRRDARVFAAAR